MDGLARKLNKTIFLGVKDNDKIRIVAINVTSDKNFRKSKGGFLMALGPAMDGLAIAQKYYDGYGIRARRLKAKEGDNYLATDGRLLPWKL